jgi:hypothetical protein
VIVGYLALLSSGHLTGGVIICLIVVGMKNPVVRMIGGLCAQIFQMLARGKPTPRQVLEFLYDICSTIPRPNTNDPQA